MKASDWLKLREDSARREGAWYGTAAGAFIGICIMTVFHLMISWRADEIHEGAMQALREADRHVLDECKSIVQDVAEAPYDEVVALKRQVDELQGRNMKEVN